jgi:hypothetical protein
MGRAYVIKCPRGQHWAQQMNRCEHASIAKCTIRPTAVKPPGTQAVVKPPGIQAAQAVESESESDEYEYDYDYDNSYKITDDPDFLIDDIRCAPDDEDRFHPTQFPHPTNCGMFYKCFDHHAYKIQCPSGLHYSEEKEECDYPEEAQCKVSIAEAQAQVPDMFAAPSVPVCPKKDVNFPVEGAYTQYFACKGGLAYLMECEAQEIFSPMTKKCEKFQMPDMSQFLNGMPQFINGMPSFPGMPMFPGMPDMSQFPGGMPPFPGGMPPFPGGMPPFPMPQFPNGMPDMSQFPMMPQMPQMPNPRPEAPQDSQLPHTRPQRPILRPEQPKEPQAPEEKLEFPSWMPVPNQNIQPPKFPSAEKPSHEKPTDKNEFNYQNGKKSSKCPMSDNPTKPSHLQHESEW